MAYFDGPGGTQTPRRVAEAVVGLSVEHHNANTHWAYPTSRETDAAIAGRPGGAALTGSAASPEEIVFGANMTTLTFHLGRALGHGWRAATLWSSPSLITTRTPIHGGCWRRSTGCEVRTIRMRPEDGRLDEADVARKLTRGVCGCWQSGQPPMP